MSTPRCVITDEPTFFDLTAAARWAWVTGSVVTSALANTSAVKNLRMQSPENRFIASLLGKTFDA